MNLGQQAMTILDRWGSFEGERRLEVAGDGISIQGEITAADKLSCSLRGLRLSAPGTRALEAGELDAWGERIAARIRYLLEALETVELDSGQGKLLLRSTPPEKLPDGTVLYYELRLSSSGELDLTRHRYDPAARGRSAEPIHATRELLGKLFNDLAATAPSGS